VDEERAAGTYLGDVSRPFSSESEHLDEDVDAELFGTSEVGKAISLGAAWNPPTGPTPEGLGGNDASVQEREEDH
jgi:hypothetical protein